MKFYLKSVFLFLGLVMILGIQPVWAKKSSYCYITAYSYNLKEAYYTPIFTVQVEGKSFNNEEYVADMKIIRKLEDALQAYLRKTRRINPAFFSFSARTGFKTEEIARRHLNEELTDLKTKGLKINELPDFKVE